MKCGKVMKSGLRQRSTMRGSAKAFGLRALKRPSRWQQFVSRKHEVLKASKNSGGEVKSETMSSRLKAFVVAVVRFIKS